MINNNKYIKILTGDGLGGQATGAFNVAHYLRSIGKYPLMFVSARDEVFKPLKHLFQDYFWMEQVSEDLQDKCLFDDELLKKTVRYNDGDEVYIQYPDLLFSHPRSFDWQKYNIHPQILKGQRILAHKRKFAEKIVFCALFSSTPEYFYKPKRELLTELALKNPDYKIVYHNLTHWAGKEIDNGNFDNLPSNVEVKTNIDILESIDVLSRSSYSICLDNGFSHLSHHFGIPKLVLSNRLDYNGLPWNSRWLEDYSDCISYDWSPKQIAKLVTLNLKTPQTCLIPRQMAIQIEGVHENIDWNNLLMIKYGNS